MTAIMQSGMVRYLSGILIIIIGLLASNTQAAGLLTPTNTNATALQIKSHHVDVVIQDGFSTTTIEQVFANPNQHDLEAMYRFPLPDKAAVSAFVFWINDQPVQGEVVEKNAAKKIYAQEKSEGRDAATMAQENFRYFEIRVHPVRAMDDVRIKLVYHQVADVDTGIDRYLYPLEEGGTEDSQAVSFWSMSDVILESFKFNLHLRSSHGVSALRVPNVHDAIVTQISNQEWQISIDREANGQKVISNVTDTEVLQLETAALESDTADIAQQTSDVKQRLRDIQTRLNQDIVVYWRLNGDLPASVDMINYRQAGSEKGTFMLTVTPADDLKKITAGRDWVFVLDKSGSMNTKFATLVNGVKKSVAKFKGG